MNATISEVEILLCDVYEHQAKCYATALAAADRLLANWQPGAPLSAALEPITRPLDEIARSAAASLASRKAWLDSGAKPGKRLSTAVEAVAQHIDALAKRIAQLETLATAQKDRLAPE